MILPARCSAVDPGQLAIAAKVGTSARIGLDAWRSMTWAVGAQARCEFMPSLWVRHARLCQGRTRQGNQTPGSERNSCTTSACVNEFRPT
jgi:hypothetical protein